MNILFEHLKIPEKVGHSEGSKYPAMADQTSVGLFSYIELLFKKRACAWVLTELGKYALFIVDQEN
jgi:hypothetical protein